MAPERVIEVRPRTVLRVAGVLLAVGLAVWLVFVARRVLVWTVVSLFLALALNPAVEVLQRRGVHRRGLAVGLVYLGVTVVIAAIGALIIPTVVDQVNGLIKAVPGYVKDLTAGRGPLGFLETKYHVVEKVKEAVKGSGGTSALAGGATAALDITRTVATFVAAVVTITFLTFFMLLEGHAWIERLLSLLPARSRPRWRAIGRDVYRVVGGYVTGNLTISLIAGTTSSIVLLALGVPYAVALGLVVALLDLIPLVGATIAAVLVTLVALSHSVTAAVVVLVFFIVYQQVENHVLQPLVYGRTVQLSPLVTLISVLIGAEVAGVLGALGAIPVAGTTQILLLDWLGRRREGDGGEEESAPPAPAADEPVRPPPGRRRTKAVRPPAPDSEPAPEHQPPAQG